MCLQTILKLKRILRASSSQEKMNKRFPTINGLQKLCPLAEEDAAVLNKPPVVYVAVMRLA